MPTTTIEEVATAAAESGYVAAMVDAISVVKRELGATVQSVRIAEELQRLATKPTAARTMGRK